MNLKFWGIFLLKRTANTIKLMFMLLKDFKSGRYKKIPFNVIAAIGLLFLYIINPFDIIYDFIPIWGQLDDVGVLMLCLYLIETETKTYQLWRSKQNKDD
ncbi:MAG: DUF1232 domain-containing protein [Candidatus Magnetomorum sp.]|nr:DUF1232 domain-containing protein [Candidatus Magnetomorum sp.]